MSKAVLELDDGTLAELPLPRPTGQWADPNFSTTMHRLHHWWHTHLRRHQPHP